MRNDKQEESIPATLYFYKYVVGVENNIIYLFLNSYKCLLSGLLTNQNYRERKLVLNVKCKT